MLCAQHKNCNYIEDYYPLIYKGQLQFLKKNHDSAYYYLKKPDAKCTLRFDETTEEIEILAKLEMQKQNYGAAASYLEKMVENGIPFYMFSDGSDFEKLKKRRNGMNSK